MYSLRINLVCTSKFMMGLKKRLKFKLPVSENLRVTNLGRPDKYISYNRDEVLVPADYCVYNLEFNHRNRYIVEMYKNFISCFKKDGLLYSEYLDISKELAS